MLKKTWIGLFDVFVVIGVWILATGGSFFIAPPILELFRTNPEYHRMSLSLVALVLIVLFWVAQQHTEVKNQSTIFVLIKKLNMNPFQWVILFFLFVSFVLSYSSLIRHHVFHSSFDLAIFSQAVWNTWHGNFLYSSIKGGICLLGDHVSPVLVLLAPLYGLWNDAQVLLVFQAVAAASAVIPIYLIAVHITKDKKIALAFAVCFAIYLPLRNSVRFDFHPEVLGIPLFLWAYYFVLKNRLIVAFMFLIFVLLTKEVACAPVAMFGLYCWWFLRKPKFGILCFLMAIVTFILAVQMVAPYFSGEEYFYLRGNYFAWREKGSAAFFHHLFQPSTFTYWVKIFLPLGFFSFLSPSSLLLTFPVLVQNLTARNMLARSIFFQYTAFLTPFVFISAIHGFHNFLERAGKQNKWSIQKVRVFAVYWLMAWSLLLMGVSEWHVIHEFQIKNTAHLDYVRRYLKTIPSHVSVRTHEFFAPHLFNRKELHIYENGHPREGGSEKALNSDYVIVDRMFLGGKGIEQLDQLRQRGYQLAHEHEGFFVFQKS